MKKTTAEVINHQNKIMILNLIRRSGTISRASLAKKSGMSAPTVTRIVDSLINTEGLVKNAGEGSSSGGRKPNLITFNGEDHKVIGIDLSPRYITAIITDLNCKVIASKKIITKNLVSFENTMKVVSELIIELINNSALKKDEIIGVGLGVAGFINVKDKVVLTSPNFSWSNVHPDLELNKYLNYPVIYDNLTRVMALGELHYGVGKKYNNFICLKLGMGLGAGVIIDRKPYIGAHGYGSEAGHTIIDSRSEYRCKCGNFGCFEALASGNFILNRISKDLNKNEYEALMSSEDPLDESIGLIKSDTLRFSQLLNELADSLAIGIINQIHSHDPQAIVLGGVLTGLGEILIDSVKKRVEKLLIPYFQTDYEILLSTHGENSVAMGAVALVLEQILKLSL